MKKQLFFDDSGLFGRDNVEREIGKPKMCGKYSDGVCSTDFCTGYVFKTDDGYKMLYFGHSKDFKGKKLFCAKSRDGINYSPEKLDLPGRKYSHEIMDLPDGSEIGTIYEDKTADENARYKLLMARLGYSELTVHDEVYTSPDLTNWTLKEGALWGNGTEPLVSVFYNKHKKCHTVIERPFWGVRLVGYKETHDFESFSDYRFCLRADSLDEPLSEIYGMYAFEYEGMYIGIPHIYRGLESELNAKYKNGIIDTQLAYSYDGRYWQRSLRKPFICGVAPDDGQGIVRPLVWVSNVTKTESDILFCCSSSRLEHGPAFDTPGTGEMLIYRLRKDGFVCLAAKDSEKPSVVSTREKVWHGGNLLVNLKAEHATIAVYDACESEDVEGMNVLGMTKPIDGFTHDDCLPFSGDCTCWSPEYKNRKMISDLAGKVLVFEIRFSNGKLFSLSGDYTDVFNTEGARYRKFGILPNT